MHPGRAGRQRRHSCPSLAFLSPLSLSLCSAGARV
jgi:hypothetical protein